MKEGNVFYPAGAGDESVLNEVEAMTPTLSGHNLEQEEEFEMSLHQCMKSVSSEIVVITLAAFWTGGAAAGDDDFSAIDHQRTTIYHSEQTPGYTCWVGAWTMPDGDLMVAFTEATGPVEGRPKAPKEVMRRLTWYPQYDMTGLDLRNVHLRTSDQGKTWRKVSSDLFKTTMNGASGECEAALPDGTVIRGVYGFYLPYNQELPQTGFFQRSVDGTKTWGKPEVPFPVEEYLAWPRRLRFLKDGRLLSVWGVARKPADSLTRLEFNKIVGPMLLVSDDDGKTWSEPIEVLPEDQRDGWTEEFDAAELPDGDLLCMFRSAAGTQRWQNILKKSGDTWITSKAEVSVLPHSGQPELLATQEGPILHVATSGIHWSDDRGQSWQKLNVPGTNYYPRAIQGEDGHIFVFGHKGGDDAYGKADQSIVMDSFRLKVK